MNPFSDLLVLVLGFLNFLVTRFTGTYLRLGALLELSDLLLLDFHNLRSDTMLIFMRQEIILGEIIIIEKQ
jgi:hypothetical protein